MFFCGRGLVPTLRQHILSFHIFLGRIPQKEPKSFAVDLMRLDILKGTENRGFNP